VQQSDLVVGVVSRDVDATVERREKLSRLVVLGGAPQATPDDRTVACVTKRPQLAMPVGFAGVRIPVLNGLDAADVEGTVSTLPT
jgi:hypothetical protein